METTIKNILFESQLSSRRSNDVVDLLARLRAAEEIGPLQNRKELSSYLSKTPKFHHGEEKKKNE